MIINKVIYAAACGWLISQLVKIVRNIYFQIKEGRTFTFWHLTWKCGMPSSHSALSVTAAVYIGAEYGIDTPLFGMAMVFTSIVLYDRIKTRQIYQYVKNKLPYLNLEKRMGPHFDEIVGHTAAEVLVGSVIGIISGIGCSLWF